MSQERFLQWLRTRSPFVWVLVTPVVTLPLSALLLLTLGGEHEAAALGLPQNELCRFDGLLAQTCTYYFDFWRTWLLLAIPGAFNLLVLLWALHRNGYVRLAAVIALVLALVRSLVVPVAAIGVSHFALFSEAGLYFQGEVIAGGGVGDIDPPSAERALRQLLTAAWIGGGVAWVVTLVVWQVYEPFMARYWRTLEPPWGPRPEEPKRWTGFLHRR